MAVVSRKGCAVVRVHRENKEKKKAQKKEWELAGTNIGNIMGIEKKEDEDVRVQRIIITIVMLVCGFFFFHSYCIHYRPKECYVVDLHKRLSLWSLSDPYNSLWFFIIHARL